MPFAAQGELALLRSSWSEGSFVPVGDGLGDDGDVGDAGLTRRVSMTVQKAPKGTVSSARRIDDIVLDAWIVC